MKTQNLRKSEQTPDALVVVGQPVRAGQVPAGHELVLRDGERWLTVHNGQLWCNGTALAAVSGTLVGVHRVGALVVVAGSEGVVYLTERNGALTPTSMGDALPTLTLTQQPSSTLTAALPTMSFASPYVRWQAPLQQADVASLTAALRSCWLSLTAQAEAMALRHSPCQFRYGVRLWDDSYLWISAPVTLGDDLVAGASRVRVAATVEGGEVTGVPATTLALPTYTLGIAVARGVDAAWRQVVKAVDVLATQPAPLVRDTSTIDYSVYTNSTRQPMLDYGFAVCSPTQVERVLAASRWTVVASTSDFEALEQGRWVESGDRPDTALTWEQCQAATAGIATRPLVATLVCNGRLYAADAQGLMTTSRAGNPLVSERQCVVSGAQLLGLAAVPRSLYSGGFGRYPVYLFTSEGVFALPLTAQGVYGEPRLLSREVLQAGTRPVEAGRDVYFTSWRGHLCRLRGSEVTMVRRNADMRSMAWDAEHSELWGIDSQRQVWALINDEHLDQRTIAATHLWGTVGQALAVAADGTVRDLTREQDAVMAVEWLSDALPCKRPPKQAIWHVYGDQVALQLDVLGERGVSCHGFVVGRLTATGRVAAPLPMVLFAPPLRTVRTHITGTASSGTLMMRCEIRP